MSLTIEKLKFAREIGATHYDFDGGHFRKHNHFFSTSGGNKWVGGLSCEEFSDYADIVEIDFSPLDDYYSDKAVDIAATGGELEYDPSDVAFNRPSADMVNHPPHYQADGIECIDAIRAALGPGGVVSYCCGNAIKHGWLAGKKDETVQDLRIAARYLNWAADELEKQQ